MIRKRIPKHETVIDLDGPEGNANNIIGTAVMLGRDHGYTEEMLK